MATIPSEIVKFLSDNISVTTSATDRGGLKTLRGLQHFFHKTFSDKNTDRIYQTLLDYAAQAEKSCSGAGMLFLHLMLSHNIEPASGTLNENSLRIVLNDLGISRINAEIVIHAYKMAGKYSKIAVKKTAGSSPVVELLDGYHFDLRTSSQVVLQKPRVICIDGYVESISEIHHLLEHFASSKEPAALFVRGMSDDVLHTIKVNQNRGTLDIHPIIVPFDLDHANTLVDIATVSSGDVVSHLKGDLISSIKIEEIRCVDSVSLSPGSIIICNSRSSIAVESHRKRLIDQSTRRPEVSEVLEKRIKSLTPSYVEISLVDGIDHFNNRSQVDEGVRRIADILLGKDPVAIAMAYRDSYDKNLTDVAVI